MDPITVAVVIPIVYLVGKVLSSAGEEIEKEKQCRKVKKGQSNE